MAASAVLNHISRVQLMTLQQQFMLLLDKAMQVYSVPSMGPVYFSDRVGPTGPVRSVKMAVYFSDQCLYTTGARGRVLR